MSVIDDLEKMDPAHVIVAMNKRDKKVFDAYRLNIKSGQMKMIAKNPGTYSGWLTDHKGKLRVATSSDGVNTSLFTETVKNKNFANW